MTDKIVINKHIANLEQTIHNLKILQQLSEEQFHNNFQHIWAAEHGLQIAIQNIIDMGGHILASLGENNINEYSDIIRNLGKLNIIPQKFAEQISGMAGFRNILIHEYVMVDENIVFDCLQKNIGDFEKFVIHIRNYLR